MKSQGVPEKDERRLHFDGKNLELNRVDFGASQWADLDNFEWQLSESLHALDPSHDWRIRLALRIDSEMREMDEGRR